MITYFFNINEKTLTQLYTMRQKIINIALLLKIS